MSAFPPSALGSLVQESQTGNIRVVGIGGMGLVAVRHMMQSGLDGVEFIGVNTDLEALDRCPVPVRIPIGLSITGGQGSEACLALGRASALQGSPEIRVAPQDSKAVIVVAGMGGGTGTGGAPVVAQIAKGLGVPIVAIVTMPFHFEGQKRWAQARKGIHDLKEYADALIVLPNDRATIGRHATFLDLLEASDRIIYRQIRWCLDRIACDETIPSHIPPVCAKDWRDLCRIDKVKMA